jgi:FkbM family methyltransferase
MLLKRTLTPIMKMVHQFRRYRLLVRRMILARGMGFHFIGTSYTPMPHHLCLFDKTIILAYPNDRTLLADVISIFLDDDYGLRSVCGKVQSVVDIGANIGLFSLWARHHFRDATIHAYEPNKEISRFAADNLKEAAVMLFHEGVSNESTAGTLVMQESSRFVKTRKEASGSIKLTGIDTVIDRIGGKLDLLKLDCEGAEWEIFLRNDVLEAVRQIRMEYHFVRPDYDMAKLKEVAVELGFKIIRIISHDDYGIAWLENLRFES